MPTKTPTDLKRLANLLQRGLHKLANDFTPNPPYGIGYCDNGRQVLFDADREPLWQWTPGQRPTACDEPVRDYHRTELLFTDKLPWYRQYDNMKRLHAILRSWGLMRVYAGPPPGRRSPPHHML